jgi:hypothetical protein
MKLGKLIRQLQGLASRHGAGTELLIDTNGFTVEDIRESWYSPTQRKVYITCKRRDDPRQQNNQVQTITVAGTTYRWAYNYDLNTEANAPGTTTN